MREVIIVIRCDVCREELTEESVLEIKAQTPLGSYEADMCHDCTESWVSEMRAVTPKRKSPKKGAFACDLCDKTFSTEAGRNRHSGQTHGKAL